MGEGDRRRCRNALFTSEGNLIAFRTLVDSPVRLLIYIVGFYGPTVIKAKTGVQSNFPSHIFNSIRIPFRLKFFFFFPSPAIERALHLLAEAKCRAILGSLGQRQVGRGRKKEGRPHGVPCHAADAAAQSLSDLVTPHHSELI